MVHSTKTKLETKKILDIGKYRLRARAGWYCVLIGESNVAIDPAIGGYGVADIYLGEFSPHSRPSRLPGAAAASSARAGFLFGVLRRPLQARQGRQGYSSSASGRLLYSETDDRGQVPLPPACPGAATGRRGLCIRRRSSWFLRPQSRLRVDLRVRVLDSNF